MEGSVVAVRDVIIRPLGQAGDLGWVVMAHGELYESHGFELVATDPYHSFGHDLVGQTWYRRL